MSSFSTISISGPSELADRPVSETVERFLRAVISEVPLEQIEELHLFSPLRQGSVETGIAVVAADVPAGEIPQGGESGEIELPLDSDTTDPAIGEATEPSVEAVVEPALDSDETEPALDNQVQAAAPARRHTVYTARYRYTIKGPERGKWESNVRAEADAPLVTVETVVRGVQRRAGEDTAIVRFSAQQIAKALRIDFPTAL